MTSPPSPRDEVELYLCALARHELRKAMGLATSKPRAPTDAAARERLSAPAAAFVSWHDATPTGDARLVGCIGTLQVRDSLESVVQHFAVQAGLHDHRTPRLERDRVDAIDLEITELSALVKFDPPPHIAGRHGGWPAPALAAALQPGRDGLEIRDDADHRAFFLPSVWSQLPEARAFVAALMRKAGMRGHIDDASTQLFARRCHGHVYGTRGARGRSA